MQRLFSTTAIILTILTGTSYAGDYPTDTSSKAKVMFMNKVAKYEGDTCQKEASMVIAGAAQQIHTERDFTDDELSEIDDVNETAIEKMGKKAWCKKITTELKKVQAEIEKPTGTAASIPDTFAYMKKFNLSPNEVCKSALRRDHLAYCLRGGI